MLLSQLFASLSHGRYRSPFFAMKTIPCRLANHFCHVSSNLVWVAQGSPYTTTLISLPHAQLSTVSFRISPRFLNDLAENHAKCGLMVMFRSFVSSFSSGVSSGPPAGYCSLMHYATSCNVYQHSVWMHFSELKDGNEIQCLGVSRH
jgi:hypothetical protein